jgi:Pyruvate/2-oxoacid:ferredoxin oxidoreductase delta subunit
LCKCQTRRKQKKSSRNSKRFNYDYCKGCGLCAQECPCGAIAMVPEAI